MPKRKPCIGITLGDINGVGPEVALKATWDVRLQEFADLVLIGPVEAAREHARRIGYKERPIEPIQRLNQMEAGVVNVLDTTDDEDVVVDIGQETKMGGRLAMEAVTRAVDLCRGGALDAMVTAPISKHAIAMAGYDVPGHTEFIADRTRTRHYTMMMVAGELRVGLVTAHLPLRVVPEAITKSRIQEKLHNIGACLRQDFGIHKPRIAVLGLNPHAGDSGVLGVEERDIIRPAIVEAGLDQELAFGPFPADGFFGAQRYRSFDAVLAMYHDQGLVPFKALSFNQGVNFTAGLPIVRTSPDHGTAFDIAGKGIAQPDSMRQAIYLALDVVRKRRSHNR